MPAEKNRNKIYVVAVICIGLVVSIWLVNNESTTKPIVAKKIETVSINPYQNQVANDDWKKILVSVDTKNEKVRALQGNSAVTFDETTLTAQMAKDFFSQYLSASRGGGVINTEKAGEIAKQTILLQNYAGSKAPLYLSSNLKITQESDATAIKKYSQALSGAFINRKINTETEFNPFSLIDTALSTESDVGLRKLDPIISSRKNLIKDLLNIETPKNLVNYHLLLINAYSEMVTTLEGLRASLTDPVRGLNAIANYSKNLDDLEIAISKINQYIARYRQ